MVMIMEWTDVIENPLLQDLPFKIELNKWGKILMSPASNKHGYIQADLVFRLRTHLPKGKVITECSIKTPDGVTVVDVAWASDGFIAEHGFNTPYNIAPEICIEVVSPSNSKAETDEKIRLYLDQGAKEVWMCNQKGEISYFSSDGKIDQSNEV